ncbi:MAG: RnfABCDGE type electron transport complex subunit G [Muribaculaceae bacterium]|nr:RnfABCDGE type electron transport complex subunit G [Muribaculaceae bacterium]
MKKLESTLPNMILSLGIICVLAATLLGGMYMITKDPIAEQMKLQQQQAIKDVAPSFNNDPEKDKVEVEENGQIFTVYPAMDNGKLVGAAVEGSSMNGFSGQVTVMCGFDLDGTVRDYRVIQQAETPGLGAKMETWFRDPQGARSVIGKNPESFSFYVTKDPGGKVDAITAATISSRAFLEILRNAFEVYKDYREDHI